MAFGLKESPAVKHLIAILASLGLYSGCERTEPRVETNEHSELPSTHMTETEPNSWRNAPLLKERFLPEYPDDLQVIVHDGGPRMTEVSPELIWVRVNGKSQDGRYTAIVLNKPHGLKTVSEGGEIQFIVKQGWEHPVQVREKYFQERPDWTIHACDKCGFDELFDAPSALIAKIFPDIPSDATMDTFTSFCPLCGGVQGVQHKDSTIER